MSDFAIGAIAGFILGAILMFCVPVLFGYSIRKIPTLKDIIEENVPGIKND